jgi:hypothetical protein
LRRYITVRDSPLYSIISSQCKVHDEDFEGGLKAGRCTFKPV